MVGMTLPTAGVRHVLADFARNESAGGATRQKAGFHARARAQGYLVEVGWADLGSW
jgi:hypothetical protein